MTAKHYLLFSLNDSLYGIDVLAVQEIFLVPDVTPIVETPEDIVGIINLRGDILPVMDLARRLGARSQDYDLNHSIIVSVWQHIRLGIIVDRVHRVEQIPTRAITVDLDYGRKSAPHDRFLAGIAQCSDAIVMLLKQQPLIQDVAAIEMLPDGTTLQSSAAAIANQNANTTPDPEHSPKTQLKFWPDATPQERQILRQRARNLMLAIEEETATELIPVAVVGLNGEYFSLDLRLVREFTTIRKVTPVPCCPAHIVGNMNLRGEIITLVDIRGALNLPLASSQLATKAMVIAVNDLIAGVAVDEVFDVTYLNPAEVAPVPATVHAVSQDYLQGTIPYQNQMMGILDLPKIFAKGDLVVEENV